MTRMPPGLREVIRECQALLTDNQIKVLKDFAEEKGLSPDRKEVNQLARETGLGSKKIYVSYF